MKPFTLFLILLVTFLMSGFIFLNKDAATMKSQSVGQKEALFDVANYVEYSETNLTAAKLRGKTLLFFAATKWCQSCSQLEKEILSRATQIPTNITILKVDYDNSTQLNTQYGVTSQHTLILLNQSGNEEKRWLGGDFDMLLQNLENTAQ